MEVVVATALLSLALAVVVLSLGRATDTARYADDRNRSLDELRLMANTFSRDIRQGVRATVIEPSAMTLETYVDNAVQTVTWQAVRSSDGTHFERIVGGTTETVYVVDLTTIDVFSYFGENRPAYVNHVRLALATRPDPEFPPIEVATEVEMRNAQ